MKKPSYTLPFLVGCLLCVNLSIINAQSAKTKIEPASMNIQDTTRLKIEREIENHIELTIEKYAYLSSHENARQSITNDLENYILGYFNKGFLAGKSPQEAYSVNVGFGISSIANKYAEVLVVEIGMTYNQPYHYKIIRKTHQMRPKDNRIIIDKNKPLPLSIRYRC